MSLVEDHWSRQCCEHEQGDVCIRLQIVCFYSNEQTESLAIKQKGGKLRAWMGQRLCSQVTAGWVKLHTEPAWPASFLHKPGLPCHPRYKKLNELLLTCWHRTIIENKHLSH